MKRVLVSILIGAAVGCTVTVCVQSVRYIGSGGAGVESSPCGESTGVVVAGGQPGEVTAR